MSRDLGERIDEHFSRVGVEVQRGSARLETSPRSRVGVVLIGVVLLCTAVAIGYRVARNDGSVVATEPAPDASVTGPLLDSPDPASPEPDPDPVESSPVDVMPSDPSANPALSPSGWSQVVAPEPFGLREPDPVLAVIDDGIVLVYLTALGGEPFAGWLDPVADEITEIPAPPTRWRAISSVAQTDGFLVIAGGSSGPGIEDAVLRLDVETFEWSVGADPPGFERGLSSNFFGGTAATAGGRVHFWHQSLVYDPTLDSWEDMPTAPISMRHSDAVAAVDNVIVVAGGCTGPTTCGIGDDPAASDLRSDAAVFDTEAGRWSLIGDVPVTPGPMLATPARSGVIVISQTDGTAAYLNPTDWTWTSIESLPAEPSPSNSVDVLTDPATGEVIVVRPSRIDVYDEDAARWDQLLLDPGGRRVLTPAIFDGLLVLAGGSPQNWPVVSAPLR